MRNGSFGEICLRRKSDFAFDDSVRVSRAAVYSPPGRKSHPIWLELKLELELESVIEIVGSQELLIVCFHALSNFT